MSKQLEIEPNKTVLSHESERQQKSSIKRLSLPTGPTSNFPPAVRKTESFIKRVKTPSITIDPIPENENENDNDGIEEVKRNGSKRSSQLSRKHNGSKRSAVYDNKAFESDGGNFQRTTSKNSLSPSVLERGSVSARSSTRNSTESLQIQREQYCCFSKWSPCERRLASCVAILATIIIILLIVIIILAITSKSVNGLKKLPKLPL